MGNGLLTSIIAAAAFRIVLGGDVGLGVDTTALSSWRLDEFNEPMPRTPWALEVRPDILAAIFNSRQYVYLTGNGSFGQPFDWTDAENGDNPEGVGNLTLGARLRLGRRLVFHPGAYVRMASSNAFIESQDEVSGASIDARAFNALYGGGWLELEVPFNSTARLLLRTQVEAWDLDDSGDEDIEDRTFFYIPPSARLVQPDLTIEATAVAWFDITRRNGLAVELGFEDSLYYGDHRITEDNPDPGLEQQYVITGRVIYRRAWLPYLMTDLSLGVTAVRPRESTVGELNAGEWILAGNWQLNAIGGASLVYFGRPRWLALRLTYERSYEQLDFRNLGSAHDAINLLAAFGPFSGFSVAVTLSWSRFAVEVQRLTNSRCQANPEGCVVVQPEPGRDTVNPGATPEETEAACNSFYDGPGAQCDYCESWTRNFNTLGLNLDLRYMYETNGFSFGPFVEAYVYTQLGEGRDPNDGCITWSDGNQWDEVCGRSCQPYVENVDCYVPRNQDALEVIAMLGFRLQWAGGNARNPRRRQDASAAISGSRAQRRLALQRMTQEERLVPGFGYRMGGRGSEGIGGAGLFGEDDPLGRAGSDPMYHDFNDIAEDGLLDEDEERAIEDEDEGVEGEEEPPEDEWFGDGVEDAPPADADEAALEGGDGADEPIQF